MDGRAGAALGHADPAGAPARIRPGSGARARRPGSAPTAQVELRGTTLPVPLGPAPGAEPLRTVRHQVPWALSPAAQM
ncbi:hypothetical protein GCM10018980_28240 [Streptomyces capoamus]|uniref:Uncharacterized protein n=1 Tax=Streptomyces capoamus TaxID=68183 RepID=A0A919EX08_9ACTN|nr:hypothetical protein GCM10010501_53570 [Streptomyces libani subsp. rufus]GHG48175.1 hypothetical protein GCM10018980_28240 [Streptomyces capoamus]